MEYNTFLYTELDLYPYPMSGSGMITTLPITETTPLTTNPIGFIWEIKDEE